MTKIEIAGWLICAVLASGGLFAYVQGEFGRAKDWREDLATSVGISLIGGPIILFIALCVTGVFKHGWRLWRRDGGGKWAVRT